MYYPPASRLCSRGTISRCTATGERAARARWGGGAGGAGGGTHLRLLTREGMRRAAAEAAKAAALAADAAAKAQQNANEWRSAENPNSKVTPGVGALRAMNADVQAVIEAAVAAATRDAETRLAATLEAALAKIREDDAASSGAANSGDDVTGEKKEKEKKKNTLTADGVTDDNGALLFTIDAAIARHPGLRPSSPIRTESVEDAAAAAALEASKAGPDAQSMYYSSYNVALDAATTTTATTAAAASDAARVVRVRVGEKGPQPFPTAAAASAAAGRVVDGVRGRGGESGEPRARGADARAAKTRRERGEERTAGGAFESHWFPYDRVRVVNADPY